MKNENCCNHPSTCVNSPDGKNCYLPKGICKYESSDVEKLMREYFDFNDINQSEVINVLPLTIVDLIVEYSEKFKYDFSKNCKCGNERIGETWCCNQCGLPVSK